MKWTMPSAFFFLIHSKFWAEAAQFSHAFFLRHPLLYANCSIAQLPSSKCSLSDFHTLIIMDLNSHFLRGNLANKFKITCSDKFSHCLAFLSDMLMVCVRNNWWQQLHIWKLMHTHSGNAMMSLHLRCAFIFIQWAGRDQLFNSLYG